ncbi:uncharacterized protein LOC127290481 [Leptopilina boulardi]|uniref:uncharacterized protein LOC127290481 n=1 Tax=Leptopilina boulardi TaxID=63433 RepID=UPI0021F60D54|nr:uncharacterized protein LOC127290481 [Leptopilina boulardi]
MKLLSLFILTLSTLLHAEIVVKPLGNIPIFAENLGTTSLYHRTWKLIIGVDTSSFDTRLQDIKKTYEKASKMCSGCQEEFELHAICNRINRLEDLQTTLDQILGFSRSKRGILNIIGSISKTLFGTLDEDDMKLINDELDNVYDNQDKMSQAIGNQTRILKTLLNSASHDLQMLNEQSESKTNQLNSIINSTNRNERNLLVANMIVLCSIAIEEFNDDLNLIINAVNDGKHGIIHPQILTPGMLIQQLREISEETNTKYPVRLIPHNYQRIIDISEINILIVNKRLVYMLRIPETEHGDFQTLHLIPIPIHHGKGFLAPIPSHEIILINNEKSLYVPSDIKLLEKCKKLENQYICKRTQPTYLISEIENCETSIIRNHNKIISDRICEFSVFRIYEIAFIPLHDPDQYIIIPESEVELTTTCESRITIINIKEPSIVFSNSDCEIHTPKSILKLRKSIEHKTDILFKKKYTLLHYSK